MRRAAVVRAPRWCPVALVFVAVLAGALDAMYSALDLHDQAVGRGDGDERVVAVGPDAVALDDAAVEAPALEALDGHAGLEVVEAVERSLRDGPELLLVLALRDARALDEQVGCLLAGEAVRSGEEVEGVAALARRHVVP